MERNDRVIDKREFAIFYVNVAEEMKDRSKNGGAILEIKAFKNETDMLTAEEFKEILNNKQFETFTAIKDLIKTDIYKEIDLMKVSRSFGITMPSGSIYIDDIIFRYYAQ
jgi:hypothetical protein